MFHLSVLRGAAGPGHTLCKPVTNANNDSPFKYLRKNPRRLCVPRDHRQRLHFVDTRRLVQQANRMVFGSFESLRHQDLHRTKETQAAQTDTFLEGCSEAAHLFKPAETVTILRALAHGQLDPDLRLTSKLVHSIVKQTVPIRQRPKSHHLDGKTLLSLILHTAKQQPTFQEALHHFCRSVPGVLYQYSAENILTLLQTLRQAQIRNADLCQWVHRKLWTALPDTDGHNLGLISSLCGYHQFRSIPFYDAVGNRAYHIGPEYYTSHVNELYALLWGYSVLKLPPPEPFWTALPQTLQASIKAKLLQKTKNRRASETHAP